MLPYDHVLPLIERGEITATQWGLFEIANDHLDPDGKELKRLHLQFGELQLEAFKVGLDVSKPGILMITGPGPMMYYIAWSELTGVMLRAS